MARNIKFLFCLILLTMVITGLNSSSNAAPFYKGKTITVYLPAPPGGGITRAAQVYIKYFAEHLEGKPTMIIKNMPGGGGLKALNFMADKGKPDGLNLYYGPLRHLSRIMDFPGGRYEIDDFDPVGVSTVTYASLIRTDTPPGIKTAADMLKTDGFKIGGQGPASGLDLFSRLPLDILGVQYKYIPGYKGQPQMNSAIRSKEINFLTTGGIGFHVFYKNTILKEGKALALFYHSSFSPQNKPILVDSYPEGIENFVEFYEKQLGKKLTGPQFEAYKWICTYPTLGGGLYTPKGVSKEIMENLREAHTKTVKDPEYKEDYIKQFSSWPLWLSGEEVDGLNQSYKDISPEAFEILKKLTTPTKKK